MTLDENFWDDMQDNGFLVVDFPGRKVAIYPNTVGQVVLATLMDDETQSTTLDPDEIALIAATLVSSSRQAKATERRIESKYIAFTAIEKARDV